MDSNVSSKLQALQKQYAEALPDKLADIIQIYDQYQANPGSELFDKLKFLAHKLAGSAGTYGYTEISVIAKRIEESLIGNDSASLVSAISELQTVTLSHLESSSSLEKTTINFSHDGTKLIYILDLQDQYDQYDLLNNVFFISKLFDNIEALIAALALQPPDIIILSTDFSDALTSALVQQFRDQFITVIYTSKLDNLAVRLNCIRHGGQLFIQKPFDGLTLSNYINNLLEAKNIANSKILIVDDSAFLAEYYALTISQAQMQTRILTDPKLFLNTLQEYQPDLMLMDINMPYCSGIELAQIVQQQEEFNSIPIIFLSSIAERAQQLQALSYAGDEFLTKPISPKQLLIVIGNRLMRTRILRMRLMRDSLTNLLNHTMVFHQLERELNIAARQTKVVSVVLIDIDHFKQVNDKYGHQAGDKVLQSLSLFLQKSLRRTDIVGRYGGEEFLVVMPDSEPEQVQTIFNTIRENFSQLEHEVDGTRIKVTFSAGIASYPSYESLSQLVHAADQALYQAKHNGRNQLALA